MGPRCVRLIASAAGLLGSASSAQQVLLIETIEAALGKSPTSLDDEDASTVFAAVFDTWAANAQGLSPLAQHR